MPHSLNYYKVKMSLGLTLFVELLYFAEFFWFCFYCAQWDWLKHLCHLLNQPGTKLKPISTWSYVFSRAWRWLYVFASSSYWFILTLEPVNALSFDFFEKSWSLFRQFTWSNALLVRASQNVKFPTF